MEDPMHTWTIAHATDLKPEGGIAFEHSVAIAERSRSRLVSLQAVGSNAEARPMPDANELLSVWRGQGFVPLQHDKVEHSCCEDPVDTLLDAMRNLEAHFLVVGTSQPQGIRRMLSGSVAESLALNTHLPTLFLPIGGTGFVNSTTGQIELKRVLVPAGDEVSAHRAAAVVTDLAERLDLQLEVYLVHVGSGGVPQGVLPESSRIRWIVEERPGKNVEAVINSCVEEHAIDLVAMATHGQDSILDILRGSQTQRVLRTVHVPMLWDPLDE
jgi:nucleotide-binding universal stress UspA family protein